jgi:hypothetical protein
MGVRQCNPNAPIVREQMLAITFLKKDEYANANIDDSYCNRGPAIYRL